jgi:hypothetical protein
MPQEPIISSSVPERNIYLPAITTARWVRRYQLGPYRAVLLTECKSVGQIHYTHVLYIFGDESRPVLAVTAEYSDDAGKDGQRFLTVFYKGVHYNCGLSLEWADLELFERKALQLAAEQLEISDPPILQAPLAT